MVARRQPPVLSYEERRDRATRPDLWPRFAPPPARSAFPEDDDDEYDET